MIWYKTTILLLYWLDHRYHACQQPLICWIELSPWLFDILFQLCHWGETVEFPPPPIEFSSYIIFARLGLRVLGPPITRVFLITHCRLVIMEGRVPFDPEAHGLDKSFRLTNTAGLKGWGCKVPQKVLLNLLEGLKQEEGVGDQRKPQVGKGLWMSIQSTSRKNHTSIY